MAAWTIAAHHLKRVVRNPGLILLLAAIPLTLALIEYAAFAPTVASGRLPPIKVLVLDEDGTFLSRAVPQVFSGGGPMKDLFETSAVADRAAARALFQRNQASALIVVPKGFEDAVLAGRTANVEFAPNALQTFSPEIARSVLEMTVLVGNGLYRRAAEPLERINALRERRAQATADDIAEISRGFFEAGQRLRNLRAIGNFELPVVRPGGDRTTSRGPNPREFFAYTLPGLAVFGLLFIAEALAIRLLRDRMLGLDRRISMAPVTATDRHAGALLFMIVALLTMFALILSIGAALFRIELREPRALLALAVGLAVFAAALQLAIAAVSKDDRTASFIATPVIMILSLAGGTFVPAENYPALLRRVAFLSPNGSAQQGFVDVLAHARTLSEVTGRVAVTWGWAVAMTGIAIVALRMRRTA